MTTTQTETRPINAGLLLADLAPEIYGLIAGYTEGDRAIELLRLTIAAPTRCSGYVTQVERGTKAVRLDALRQLQRAGVEFSCDVEAIN